MYRMVVEGIYFATLNQRLATIIEPGIKLLLEEHLTGSIIKDCRH